MRESKKYIYLMITSISNVVYLYVLDCWKYILEGKLIAKDSGIVDSIVGILLGAYAILVLAFSETSILVQLYYRKEYSMYERKCLDNNMKIQVSLLVFYYISSLIFSKMVSLDSFMWYLVMLPILMAVNLNKMSKTVWEKEDAILFMDVNGQMVDIDEICVGKDTIELVYKSEGKKSIKKTKKIKKLYSC